MLQAYEAVQASSVLQEHWLSVSMVESNLGVYLEQLRGLDEEIEQVNAQFEFEIEDSESTKRKSTALQGLNRVSGLLDAAIRVSRD